MSSTKIEWTEATWNPVTGCTKISEGCRHCYAERMAMRLQAMGAENYRDGFLVRCHEKALLIPFSWKRPRMIFVNSMSDLFHKDIPFGFLHRIFEVMNHTPQHTYQILTKRADRLSELAPRLSWTPNIWMGVTVESQGYVGRIDCLRTVGAAVRFISMEPLLGPVNADIEGIDWVIVGGESGPGARPMRKEWVTEIRDQCIVKGVPFFFKQWGGVQKKKNGRLLENRTWDGMPESRNNIFA